MDDGQRIRLDAVLRALQVDADHARYLFAALVSLYFVLPRVPYSFGVGNFVGYPMRMNIHIHGLSCIEGKVAVVLDLISPDGSKQTMFMPTGYAHNLACTLIEYALIGRSNEATVKEHPGTILDPTAAILEFGTRVEERMKLNDSTAAVQWQLGHVN